MNCPEYDMPRYMRGPCDASSIMSDAHKETLWQKSWPIAIIFLIVAVLGSPVVWGVYQMRRETNAAGENERNAPFHVGQQVRTKIGGFRGYIIGMNCHGECAYSVRFAIASMEPQRMSAFEIEAAP